MNQRLKSMAAVMLAAMMTVTTNAQVTAPDWENPAVLGINKLVEPTPGASAHSPHTPSMATSPITIALSSTRKYKQ